MRIAAIPGDGIGPEVLPAATEVLDAALALHGESVQWNWLDWGCDYYVGHGAMMPGDGLDILAQHDAIFLGAVGRTDVPDHISLWGLLIPIRRAFDQYINLRPARLFAGVSPRVVMPEGTPVDILIVRENTEGEYSELGGRFGRGTEHEFALQESVFSRRGIERVTRFAFEMARSRSSRLTSATKSNGIIHTMPFWDEVVNEVARDYPDVTVQSRLIDALAADLVIAPQQFDVIVASNLFGDILSDIAAVAVGSLGLAASANLDPERRYPSMFEPVHGSAPDIVGRNRANPMAAVWSGAMMLEHLGFTAAADSVLAALEECVASPTTRTADIGGTATTTEAAKALIAALNAPGRAMTQASGGS
jgi:tartrate dehydrogenase/decarboxylase/D-malate dehydrogenase